MQSSGDKIFIIADDRERQSNIPEILSAHDDVDLTVRRLTLGDYILNNRILIERKTLKDLASSIIDGRIFKQAAMLANPEFQSALILEGTSKDLKKCNISRQGIQGALIYVSIVLGIPILRSISPDETVQLMLYTAN
jgi:DNA excision repair protein ERCC-4